MAGKAKRYSLSAASTSCVWSHVHQQDCRVKPDNDTTALLDCFVAVLLAMTRLLHKGCRVCIKLNLRKSFISKPCKFRLAPKLESRCTTARGRRSARFALAQSTELVLSGKTPRFLAESCNWCTSLNRSFVPLLEILRSKIVTFRGLNFIYRLNCCEKKNSA